jgi:predicted esterase
MIKRSTGKLRQILGTLLVFAGTGLPVTPSIADSIVLKNGMQLDGTLGKISNLGQNPLAPTGGAGQIKNQLIVIVDDDLRRTFVSTYQVQTKLAVPPEPLERILIKQRVAERGTRVAGVGAIIRVTPFDEWGRRIFSMTTLRGPLDVVQGITEITPRYTKVEALQGKNNLVWDMRIETNSISRETLSSVLMKNINANQPDDRLKIVRLYLQSERYRDARLELEAVIEDFPELKELERQVRSLRQMSNQRVIKEIDLYREAGQHTLAHRMLSTFPPEDAAVETLLRIREMLAEYEKAKTQGQRVLDLLDKHAKTVKDAKIGERIERSRLEIHADLNINNLNRFAGYLRLADDDELGDEQKLALAISGWLLGPGSEMENLAVAQSLVHVRDLVWKYLRSDRPHERQDIAKQLGDEEGATPENVAKIIAHMKPPIETPNPEGIYGYYKLTVPGLSGQADVTYHLQLPPEYDPYRRYPAIVTMNAVATTPEKQVDWWAGGYSEQAKSRLGQAARRGYIVIAPAWTKEHQRKYEYSAREHAAVLFSLRDACRRFSIDTDKVFLSGHSMGGDAAWDIGLAHPDLWAGVIPFVPVADKYVSRYWPNAKTVPLYFVTGELDGDKLSRNAQDMNRYLKRTGYDVMITEYLGRGHEHYHDDIQRVFKWMSLHERNFSRDEFECVTMRAWDNFFWFVEMSEFPQQSTVNPYTWPPNTGARPAIVEGNVFPGNRVSVKTNVGRAKIWLSPEMVDFSQRMTVAVNGQSRSELIRPSVATILDDVRTRGDRQHPFWAMVDKDTGRGGRVSLRK